MQTLRTSYGALTICFAVMLAVSSLAVAEDLSETFDQTYPLSVGGTVSLENINGNVEFEVWGAQEVRVLAVKEASSQKRLDGLKV
ncbi:MAG: hypothetical protein GY906_04545, partial [bacterium]|nr:hypothetical protein [bacterium]